MVKKVANEDKVLALPTSDNALLLMPDQYTPPKNLAVIGKGMRRNNLLLPQALQANIQRWYPWSGFQQRLVKRNRTLLSLLPRSNTKRVGVNNESNSLRPDAFIGWGQKKSYQRANKAASSQNLTALSIEDGFLRSLDSGVDSRHGLSVVVDDIGIYFDMTSSSRLEQLIVTRTKVDSTSKKHQLDKQHAQQLMARICAEKLSKYNSVIVCPLLDELIDKEHTGVKNTASKTHVLLIDQVLGDASIKGAGANKRQFKQMLKTACRQHPNANIWIKAHPASTSGYLTSLPLPKNVRLLSQALNPIELLSQVNDVYTVSSHMGFEALMLGKTVHCFGVSWYSGWGLTDDSGAPKNLLKAVQQRRKAFGNELVKNKNYSNSALFPKAVGQKLDTTLETLFYSAYIDYSRYADPATKQPCDINTAIDWLVTNRYWQSRLEGSVTVYEFSRWKLPFVRAFTNLPRTTLFIKPKPRLKNLLHPDHFRVDYKQPLLVWGLAKRQKIQSKRQNKLVEQASNMPAIYCMEDGFIRSNGLGATLLAPLSVVIDTQGIYYDATQPSDLETLLRDCHPLSPQQVTRVQRLRDKLLTQRVSKYNVGGDIGSAKANASKNASGQRASWMKEAKASEKPRILIIGQVEDDLSVQHCGSTIKTNSGLIERVCQDNPDAYLIYKPHPDVEAGLRAGKVTGACLQQVEAVAYDTAMPDCLEWVDEIHTISSLTGFEALLRGLRVTCYGLPFYAGWGLTTDIDTQFQPKAEYLSRRKRATPLSLEQLLYSALICYPLYRLPNGYGLAQVEQVIDYLYPIQELRQSVDSQSGKGKNVESEAGVEGSINGSAQSSISSKPSVRTQLKQRLTTAFMQQRHQWQQRLRK